MGLLPVPRAAAWCPELGHNGHDFIETFGHAYPPRGVTLTEFFVTFNGAGRLARLQGLW